VARRGRIAGGASDALLFVWAGDCLSVAFHGLALFYLYLGLPGQSNAGSDLSGFLVQPKMAPPIHPR
jgi:hypothetical protein